MTQRERESLDAGSIGDYDAHSLLFGDDDDNEDAPPEKLTRADRRRNEQSVRRRRHRRGRWFVLLTVVIVAAVGLVVVPRVVDYFKVADYSGSGSGAVRITIPSGASAGDIGTLMHKAGVVKSSQAFTDAASDNSKSESIQPGVYNLRRHMSGTSALNLLLDPASRNANSDVVVTEGATTLDVAAKLEKACGASPAALTSALNKPADLGIPVTYKIGVKNPTSAEGFLYPATYTPDTCAGPADLLQKMVSRFIQQDRDTSFAANAPKKSGLTPYQALIVASIAQSEAKFASDMPKVVRTILNRLKANRPLQFDSTSSYACKLAKQTRCIYDQVDSPYNTYTNKSLPPTPIDNPGAEAMAAAVHPAAGNYLFFVNQDKAGHLFFTNDDKAFEKARVKCVKNNWGCG